MSVTTSQSVTTADVTAWKNDLEAMLSEVTDPSARASLDQLQSALEPYFATPELFRSMLGKIQMVLLAESAEDELTTTEFTDMDQLRAALPEGLAVTGL